MSKVGNRKDNLNGCVILVCVINKPNKILTHDKFFKIFSPFGTIQRILIFERGVIWKTFVEYSNPESANRARTTLNGQDFGGDSTLKINVYVSQLERITFQENNSGGVDYTILRSKQQEKYRAQSSRSFQVQGNNHQENQNFFNNQMNSQTTSPLYPLNQSGIAFNEPSYPFQSNQNNQMFNFTQQQFNLSHQYSPLPSFSPIYPPNLGNSFQNQNYFSQQQSVNNQYLQQQLKIQQSMQQQVQKINQIMFLLQQSVNEQQIGGQLQKEQMVLYAQKQIILLNELNDSKKKLQLFADQYQNFLQQFFSISSSEKKLRQVRPLFEDVDDSDVPIQYIKTISDEILKEKNENDESKNRQSDKKSEELEQQSREQEMNDEIEQAENELIFKCFQNPNENDFSEKETRQILQKMNQDVSQAENQKEVFSLLQNSIIQKSNQTQEKINDLIQQNRANNLSENSPSLDLYQSKSDHKFKEYSQNPGDYINPLFLKVVRQSKVIYARWFDKQIITLRMLYNLFSTYGNIDKMIYLKEKSSALIQYETLDYANQAKESLNDVMFYGQQLKIFFSNYEEIYLKGNMIEKGQIIEDPNAVEEYFHGCEESNRFKNGCNYSFTPPSEVVQINNLSAQSCQNEIILEIFGKHKELLQIKQLTPNFQCLIRFISHPDNKNVCFLKYDSVETSMIALANLHGIELDQRILHLTFSKQKL